MPEAVGSCEREHPYEQHELQQEQAPAVGRPHPLTRSGPTRNHELTTPVATKVATSSVQVREAVKGAMQDGRQFRAKAGCA